MGTPLKIDSTQIKRGPIALIPELLPGEQYWAKDTKQLFIGTAEGNKNITEKQVSVTYDQLATLIGESGLLPGQKYLITDYKTIYIQPVTNTLKSDATVEPLVVTALDVDKLEPIAFSPSKPKDVIYYDVENDTTKYEWADATSRGVIYRRIDQNGNDLPYDFKVVKFRRWAIDIDEIPTWSSTEDYEWGAVVKTFISNTYRVFIQGVNKTSTNETPDTPEGSNWILYREWNISDSPLQSYVGLDENSVHLNLLDILEVVIPIQESDGLDFYTFNSQTAAETDISDLTSVYKNVFGALVGRLSNTVFIGSDFRANTVGNDFSANTVGNNFNSNTVVNYFGSNTVGNNFSANTVGNYFSSNTVSNSFSGNTVGSFFSGNTVGNNFRSNTVGNYFNNNTVSNSFNNNTLLEQVSGVDFSSIAELYSKPYPHLIFSEGSGVITWTWYDGGVLQEDSNG